MMSDSIISKINEKKKFSKLEYPTSMMLELTNACNHSCLFCSHRKSERKVVMMNYDFAIHILDEAYECGVRELALFMMGESFLYPHIVEVIQYAKTKGYDYIYITTNGAKANPEILKSVIEAGVDSIKFSINAISRKEYQLIHGCDDFENVMIHLKWLYQYKIEQKLPIHIYISSIITKYNNNESLIKEKLGEFCDEIVTYKVANRDGMMPEVDRYLKCDNEEYMIDTTPKNPCPMVFNRYHVTAEGYLCACCSDINNYLAYADLHIQSLHEAWNNSAITEFRERHLQGNLEGSLCYNCIHNTCDIDTQPLVKEFASLSNMESIFSDDEVKRRIDNYSVHSGATLSK